MITYHSKSPVDNDCPGRIPAYDHHRAAVTIVSVVERNSAGCICINQWVPNKDTYVPGMGLRHGYLCSRHTDLEQAYGRWL